jgi:CHAT domain-containing protein/Tfp pilus assembly protein PilF
MLRALFAVALATSQPVVAQDAQKHRPPKLEPVFADDFSKDTRPDYKVTPDVGWNKGQLSLPAGASIERTINGGPWVKAKLKLAPLDLTEDRSQSEVRIWFLLDGATNCYVRLRQRLEDGKTVSSISLVDTGERDGQPIEQVVREVVAGETEPGEIRVEYRNGLVRVELPGKDAFASHVKNGSATVRALALQSRTVGSHLASLAVASWRPKRKNYTDAERKLIAKARDENTKLGSFYRQGKFVDAAKLGEQVLAIHKSVLGEQHPDYATSLNVLAAIYTTLGDYARAEPLQKEALDIRKSLLGEQHPDYTISMTNLVALYKGMGDYARAEPLQKQAPEIYKLVLGEQHPLYARSLNNLAFLYSSMGDYARAEPLLEQALEINKSVLGERHPSYATNINNLALLYYHMSDYARAEPLFKQALDIRKAVLGEQDPDYATSLNNLAFLHSHIGDYARAEPLFKQALHIRSSVLGKQHPDCAQSLNNLALLYSDIGDYARAEPLFKQALNIRSSVLGEQHPDYATSLNNLASLYSNMGNYARAKPLYKQALEINKSVLGEQHPLYATSLHNLASLYQSMGDYAGAEPLFKQAVRIQRDQWNATATVQSARQQNCNQSAQRFYLDSRLSNSVSMRSSDAGAAAGDLWQWKGAVTARQQAYRRVAGNPKLAPLFAELQSVTRQLSVASGQIPNPPATSAPKVKHNAFRKKRGVWQQRVAGLTRRREDLEQQIAADSEEFRRITEPLTTDILQSLLPQGTAFIDFLKYSHATPAPNPKSRTNYEQRYLAVVVAGDGPVRLVGLGSSELIRDAITAFRGPLAGQRGGQKEASQAAQDLREMLWLPVEKHLAGIKTVIISPDTALGTLPFAALPGREPASYLIEDYTLVSIPFANLLRTLSDPREKSKSQGLLVMGDVDYDSAGPSNTEPVDANLLALASEQGRFGRTRVDQTEQWASLSGFRGELNIVQSLHQQRFGSEAAVKVLSEAAATEASFLQQAPKFSTLHLITHGFFSDPKVKSIGQAETKTDGLTTGTKGPDPFFNKWLPGLLSGLVMAGANKPSDDPEDMNDGILRASEIEASSMQGVDLVVLSACETGLGTVAGGEGLTGLQRAFQIAGARSVVASLWKVNDRATQELMKRFYTNLWVKKMSKVEALRQAQLWMLRNPDKLKTLGVENPTLRGKGKLPKVIERSEKSKSARTDPFYWAAFQLSGDWR